MWVCTRLCEGGRARAWRSTEDTQVHGFSSSSRKSLTPAAFNGVSIFQADPCSPAQGLVLTPRSIRLRNIKPGQPGSRAWSWTLGLDLWAGHLSLCQAPPCWVPLANMDIHNEVVGKCSHIMIFLQGLRLPSAEKPPGSVSICLSRCSKGQG